MTEIEKIEQINEMEKLRDIIPGFAKALPDPFLRSVQQDVEMPTWNKIQLPDNIQGSGGAGATNPTFQAIVVQNGIGYYATVFGTVGAQI